MDVNCLYQGDCIQGMERLEAESVDLVFADPPFNIGYEYDAYNDRCDSEEYLSWTKRWGQAVKRVLKPTGTFWLAIGDEYAAELKLIFQKELGFTCRSWVIWYYTFGVNCTKKFSRSHAHLFYFVKNPKRFTFNSSAIKVPSARQLVYADSRAAEEGRVPDDTWILRPQDLPEGFRANEDTWYFRRVCGTFKERTGWHGCQMPERLLGRIIRACSNRGDLVLDPFAGSGTTLVVAKKLSRRWLGFETSKTYFERIQARINNTTEGVPLASGKEVAATVNLCSGQRRDPAEIKRGIIEAFFAIRDGFSADRVIADPELNGPFLEICRRFGLPGQPSQWNHLLMNLRKTGYLSGLPRSRRTSFAQEDIDRYGFACEIAMQHFKQEEGRTLDQVLCEPSYAAELDRFVRTIVPEDLPSLKIRWIALHIRKSAKKIRKAGSALVSAHPQPRTAESAVALDLDVVPPSPGLYWLQSPQQRLYVGETLDLRRRFELQLIASGFDFWGTKRPELMVRYCELPEVDRLKPNQSRWIYEWKPVGNYSGLSAVL